MADIYRIGVAISMTNGVSASTTTLRRHSGYALPSRRVQQ